MKKKYFGYQTTAALQNFPFSTNSTQIVLIYAITKIKKAAAIANYKAGNFDKRIKDSIVSACDEILKGNLDDQFVTPALQGGAGTSVNMNVNEVIANIAKVHPNDHVNCSQSTNDVNPSALKISCIYLTDQLLEAVDVLTASFEEKAGQFKHISKLARTHLQDAIPISLGEEFSSFAETIKNDKKRILQAKEYLFSINLGGTAVGNSINASKEYIKYVYEEIVSITKLPLKPAKSFMSQTSSQTDFCMLSQSLVTLALDASKIASDIRLLSSGPNGGIGEISLQKLQAGSSIMPGKVNPVLPESVNQLYFLVSGNNLTIEHAAHGAQLQLGVMLPILADSLFTSLILTKEVLGNFAKICVLNITANEKRCTQLLESSSAYATLLVPILGYDVLSAVVEKTMKKNLTLRDVIVGDKLMTEEEFDAAIKIN